VSGDGTVGLYRVEISLSSGTGKLKLAGGVSGAMKESVNRAFSYLSANKTPFGVPRDLDTSDFHVEVIDLLGNKVEAEIGVAFFIAAYSALRKSPPQAASYGSVREQDRRPSFGAQAPWGGRRGAAGKSPQINVFEFSGPTPTVRAPDGGESREAAALQARHAMRVYRYRLIDKPDSWLTMIAPDCDLEEARRSLRLRFGERLTAVVEHRHRRLPR
jgi:hypothetical protein